jgi:polyisoprenyl-phosphate glycosyltransferase
LSIVIPVYNEDTNLNALTQRIDKLISQYEISTQVIFVDDHSSDATPALLAEICRSHPNYEYIRLAANSGSHTAIIAGMAYAAGDAVAFLAADLQDPPELIPQMLNAWREGAHVVWAVREMREGISSTDKAFSSMAYRLINLFGNVKLPPAGSDFALLDQTVVKALMLSCRANPSLGLEIARLGFTQIEITYTKAARHSGTTKWTLNCKIKAFIDAIITTSFVPLRLMSYVGLIASIIGFGYAVFLIILRFITPNPIEGWTALMVVILLLCGIQMIMLGIIGEYVWRTLETSRNRPLYIVEKSSIQGINKQ